MAEMVGFSRNICFDWLDYTALCRINAIPRQEAAEKLNTILAKKYSAPDNIRKTRTILLRIWYDADQSIIDVATKHYEQGEYGDKLAIHWSLILLQYPIFVDLCEVIGHLMSLRDTFSVQQISQKIYDKWGERNTLTHSLSKNIQTLKDISVLTPCGKGFYVVQQHPVCASEVVAVLLKTVIIATGKQYITWNEFAESPLLFPFDLSSVSESLMTGSEYIHRERMGDQIVLRCN